MDPQLTQRQREVLDFIQTFSETHGVPPTVREIGGRFHVTPRAAFDHLKALERKGYLKRRATAGRTSRALDPGGAASVEARGADPRPYRRRRAAPRRGESRRRAAARSAWVGGRATTSSALRVHGESMINAHIVEGDLVLVRRQDHAQSGDIVVALVDGEATVKRVAREPHAVVLKPEHPTMAPIVIREGEKDVRIVGKVVGLVRGL